MGVTVEHSIDAMGAADELVRGDARLVPFAQVGEDDDVVGSLPAGFVDGLLHALVEVGLGEVVDLPHAGGVGEGHRIGVLDGRRSDAHKGHLATTVLTDDEGGEEQRVLLHIAQIGTHHGRSDVAEELAGGGEGEVELMVAERDGIVVDALHDVGYGLTLREGTDGSALQVVAAGGDGHVGRVGSHEVAQAGQVGVFTDGTMHIVLEEHHDGTLRLGYAEGVGLDVAREQRVGADLLGPILTAGLTVHGAVEQGLGGVLEDGLIVEGGNDQTGLGEVGRMRTLHG